MNTDFLVEIKVKVQCLFISHNKPQMTALYKWFKMTSLHSNVLGKKMTWSSQKLPRTLHDTSRNFITEVSWQQNLLKEVSFLLKTTSVLLCPGTGQT